MNFLKNLFSKKNNNDIKVVNEETSPVFENDVTPINVLNLKKNDILNLTKTNPTLKNITLASGWDIAKGCSSYDLDLFAFLLDKKGNLLPNPSNVVYFANMYVEGIKLHGDNRTGEGDGDDETMTIKLDLLPSKCKKIVFAISIFNSELKGQSFQEVENAYIRLLNADNHNMEICKYNLTKDGGKNRSLIFAELSRVDGEWMFKAVGKYVTATYKELINKNLRV